MKKYFILHMTFLVMTMLIFSACQKTDMEKAQDAYSASQVIPVIISTSGPSLALQTFSYDFKIGYNRAGSTWAWNATDATISVVSTDTKIATVLFNVKPANDTAVISITETTSGGVVSPVKNLKVKVDPFCPLAIQGFVGAWSGTDGFASGTHNRPSQVVTSAPDGSEISVTGLNFGWIDFKWGETITDGGLIKMTINNNGTLEIESQYCFTTDYDGAPYEYWIEGSGTWSNCGASPTMTIKYVLDNKTDGYLLPSEYYAFDNFTALLTLGTVKGAAVERGNSEVVSPSFKKRK